MTITNETMTAALWPVREELSQVESFATEAVHSPNAAVRAGAVGMISAAKDIRTALDRIHPEPDKLAELGMVAIGMLREHREKGFSGMPSAYCELQDWYKRADELLAAAQTKEDPDRH